MGLSKNIGQYQDVDIVLSAALKSGGAHYQLRSENDAIRWRQRAYFYRKLLYDMELEKARQFPGMLPSTPYDGMTLRIEGPVVSITLDKPTGTLRTLDGKPIEVEGPKDDSEDELERVAREFAERLGPAEE